MTERTVIVAGAAGFIGAAVSARLLETGCRVIGLDNLNNYYSTRLKHRRLEPLTSNPRFQFSELDIVDRSALEELFSNAGRVDAVINLAAQAGVRHSFADPVHCFRSNVVGCLNLLDATQKSAIPKFILASSSTLYANSDPPFSEDSVTGTTRSPYAESKKKAESIASGFHEKHELDVTVLRYFTVYGPAGRPDMAYLKFAQAIDQGKPILLFGDGHQARDFTHIDDIVRGTIAALQPAGYQVFNLGQGGQPISMLSLIERIGKQLQKTPNIEFHPPQPGDMDSTQADNTRARQQLNWEPQVEFESGIVETIEWYKHNRDLFLPDVARSE